MSNESFSNVEVTERSGGTGTDTGTDSDLSESESKALSMFERQAVRVANRPCTYFWVSLIISLILSVIGMWVGEFEISVDGNGWLSRGTQISDRHSQFLLVHLNRDELVTDYTGVVWEDLINNVQPGWESDDDEVEYDRRLAVTTGPASEKATLGEILDGSHPLDIQKVMDLGWELRDQTERRLPFPLSPDFKRKLQSASETVLLSGCDTTWYENQMLADSRLWPIWRPKDLSEPKALLSEDVLKDLCLSEEITQQALIDNDLCYGCSDGGCLPPYSIVLFARLTVQGGTELACEQLGEAWVEYNNENQDFEQELIQCAEDLESSFLDDGDMPDSCPAHFSPIMIDELFSTSGDVTYTSSVFATKSTTADIETMYDAEGAYSRGTPLIEGVYDTQDEDFGNLYAESALGRDMGLALGSAFITALAILIHTHSPLLTGVGLLQIVLSFPLSYFIYTFFGQLDFFPFLNFIGIFVVFALGADDVFVAVDKWKNARLEHGTGASTAEIAAIALPDAAGAMFLTTLTTAVAFFGTAICPVAPIRCFSIFVGLLIVTDYIMCLALVFPALCIYDRRRHDKNCCYRCSKCRGTAEEEEETRLAESEEKPSLIRRILTSFYDGLHSTRYLLLALSFAAFVLCIIFSTKMDLPTSSDVRMLDSSNEFEKNFLWRQKLLYDVLEKKSGSTAYVMWGTTPADTGDHNNPESFSQLVLDERFEASKQEAQIYLRDFCDKFFANEWASPIQEGEKCPINRFDDWLHEQSSSAFPDQIYVDYCGGATGLPLAEGDFDNCIYNWGQQFGETFILACDGKVEVIYFHYNSRVRFDSPYDDLDNEWNTIETWMNNERATAAPATASGMYFTSEDYWWYDTNGRMLSTAYTAAAIAIVTGALVVLFSSRSVVLTIFSSITICYVLASVTAVLVAFGWTLGFLEAICFAILIGLSCDFVIHFSHAYASLPGDVDRHERTKYALIRMGPSILAAGITSMAAAAVMLFTVITFFVKFGVILLVTIVQATTGSFIVFLVLTDCFGPSNPTYVVDQITDRLFGKKEEEDQVGMEDSDVSPKKFGTVAETGV